MAPSTGSEPQSAEGQAQRRVSRCRLVRPAPPTPKTRRMIISAPGTPAWYTAAIARTPCRIVARCSALVRIRSPGWSVNVTTGRWNAEHRSTSRVTADVLAHTRADHGRAGHEKL